MRRTFFSLKNLASLLLVAGLGLVGCEDFVSTTEEPTTPDQEDVVVDPIPSIEDPRAEDPELLPDPEAIPLSPSFQKVEKGMQIRHLPGQTGILGWKDTRGWPTKGAGAGDSTGPDPSTVIRVGDHLTPIDIGQHGFFYGGAAVDMSGERPAWGDNTNLAYELTPPEECELAMILEGEVFVGTALEALIPGIQFNEKLYGVGIICPK